MSSQLLDSSLSSINKTNMELNYPLAGLVLIAVAGLIFFLIRRNRRDKKNYERDLIESELKPEKHDTDHV